LEGETTSGEVFPVKSLQRSGVKGLTDSARFESRTGDSQKRVSFDEARTDLLESGRFKTTEVRGGVIVDFAGARSGVVGSAFVADGRVLHVSFAAA
jgi:very-short-patch-repair endonuclease